MKSSTNANLQPIYEPRVGVVMCEYTTVQYTRFLIEISVSPLVSGPPAYRLSCLVFCGILYLKSLECDKRSL